GGLAPAEPEPSQRPVVDREAADPGCGHDLREREAGKDDPKRKPHRDVRPAGEPDRVSVYAGIAAEHEYLGDRAHGEPGVVSLAHGASHVREPGEAADSGDHDHGDEHSEADTDECPAHAE